MKTGKTLVELATEIERRSHAKRDFVVNTAHLHMTHDSRLQVTDAKGDLAVDIGVNAIAHNQLGEHCGIPSKYYDRMLVEQPALLAANVNTWLHKAPSNRMVRTLDGNARAVLSDRYRPIENEQLFEAIVPVLTRLNVEIMSADVTDRRFYIKAVDKRITKDVPTGRKIGDGSHVFFDTLSPAMVFENSEVGLGALQVKTSVFTKVCTNLATLDKAGSVRKYHIGGRHELGEEIYGLLSDRTKALNDAALWAKIQDVVTGAFDRARFDALVDEKIVGMTAQPIKGDPIKAIDLSQRAFGFTDVEKGSVLRHLIEGGDLTRYGLFNALTRTAEDIEAYDRATEFERMGGALIELAANDWQRIAEAA